MRDRKESPESCNPRAGGAHGMTEIDVYVWTQGRVVP